ncbi:hypothetical protein [Nocardia arthritidis]|uniref:hypothetical protein n=1 Tax=Nocardia arthritidis TaxID=228602 RepID=UPI0007A3D854|nr:hypothetical protein [Nocardia arthritidis]
MHDGERRDGYCYSLAVSVPCDVVHLRNEEFVSRAIESLHQHYPEARTARVLRPKVIHQP